MKRMGFSALAGGLFGLGLTISGMTDTARIQGWLDVFGDWNPTLAWRVAAARQTSVLGTTLPQAPDPKLDPNLIIGSVMFGMGWGLAGLCPGPALASLSFGGVGGAIFLIAMIAGMVATPAIRRRIDRRATA